MRVAVTTRSGSFAGTVCPAEPGVGNGFGATGRELIDWDLVVVGVLGVGDATGAGVAGGSWAREEDANTTTRDAANVKMKPRHFDDIGNTLPS